jgi:hypothetical protein
LFFTQSLLLPLGPYREEEDTFSLSLSRVFFSDSSLSNVLPSSNKKPLNIPSPAKKLFFNEISRGNFIARNQEAEIEDFSEKHREVWRGCEEDKREKA